MNGLKWYRVIATYQKWATPERILTGVIIAAMIILFIVALSIGSANAHETHLSSMVGQFCTVVTLGQISGDTIAATDCSGDGKPDTFWRIYKTYDLSHVALHVESLDDLTARKLLILQQLNN